jgi:DNA-binding protein HU-beta
VPPFRVTPETPVRKPELIQILVKRHGLSRRQAGAILDTLFSKSGVIAGELRRGGKVQLSGFGHFEVRKRKPRTGRNPRTGKAITIKASVGPAFRAAKSLKAAVNKR